jgi:hypothetical protein
MMEGVMKPWLGAQFLAVLILGFLPANLGAQVPPEKFVYVSSVGSERVPFASVFSHIPDCLARDINLPESEWNLSSFNQWRLLRGCRRVPFN